MLISNIISTGFDDIWQEVMQPSLKEKTVKSICWVLIEKFGVLAAKLTLGIILARMLTPKDYGLIGMISVFFTIAQVFVNSGFNLAYVQKKEITNKDANTVFFFNLTISIAMYWILWIAAPLIADFYDQPKLIGLTRVMGLTVIINAFNIIQVAQVTRNVEFKRKTKVTLMTTLFSGTGGVIAAYYGLGVWSLVIQALSNQLLSTTGLWITNKWSPTFQFSEKSFKNMFSVGAWIFASSIMRTIFNNIYILAFGKLFPAAQLGFYIKAKQIPLLSSQQLSGAVRLVSFPIFSQMQDNKDRLQTGMRKILRHTLIITMPVLVTLIVVAKPFIILFLTEKWAPLIPYMQLFCIGGFLYPIHAVNLQVLLAQGKSNLNFNLAMIKNVLRITNILVMYRFGVIYIIIGEIALSFIALFINTFYTQKLIGYGILKQWNDIRKIVSGVIIAGLFGYFISFNLDNLWVMFLVGAVGTISFFIIFQYLFNRDLFEDVLLLKDVFLKKKRNR